MNREVQHINLWIILKFILPTTLGILLLLIPFSFSNGVDTVLFHFLKIWIHNYYYEIQTMVVLTFVIGTILAIYDRIFHPNWISQNSIYKALFSTTDFYLVNRIIGMLIAVCCYFNIGPEFMISKDTGEAMLDLATQLSILIPAMLLLQTLVLEFGAMEFIGGFIGFVIKPIFKISEICAVSLISAWVGPGPAGVIGTKALFDKGYFTVREFAIISSQFSIASIGWIILISNVLNIMDYFAMIYLCITIVGIFVAAVCIRIPPISNYPDIYVDGSPLAKDNHEVRSHHNKLQQALVNACTRAQTVKLTNFTDKKESMLFYMVWLMPIIMCWGTFALIISLYSPILSILSYPIELFLNLFNVSESKETASAIMSGFADSYLPVILGNKVQSVESRMIIAIMSILELIYLSEIATLLKSTKALTSYKDIFVIFLLRTFISLPMVIIFVKIIIL